MVFRGGEASVDGSVAKGGRSEQNLPAGFALVEFEPWRHGDGEVTEQWVALRANRWNTDARSAWRFDLDHPECA